MCIGCGCGEGEAKILGGALVAYLHTHADGSAHHPATGPIAYRPVHAGHARDQGGPTRRVLIEQDVLAKNNAYARENRARWSEHGIFAINLVSSPGSGKTTLLVRTIEMLKGGFPLAVIEGDQQTSRDADRIRATGAPAIQINTGKGCHLDAHMVGHAFAELDVADGGLLLIENVGNLVCPAEFDLGEAHKVVILSVTEGEDKPLKYPNMFAAADLMVLTKIDLLPYVSFDVAACIDYARRVRPGMQVLQLSATTGAGMEDWLAWLRRGVAAAARDR
jgi:hydrogenase nickel incorporation protein HypB